MYICVCSNYCFTLKCVCLVEIFTIFFLFFIRYEKKKTSAFCATDVDMPKSEGMSDIIRWQPYITPGRVRSNPLRAEELPQQETKPGLSLLPSAFNNQNERYLWDGP